MTNYSAASKKEAVQYARQREDFLKRMTLSKWYEILPYLRAKNIANDEK